MGLFRKRQYHFQGTPYAACVPTIDALLKVTAFTPECITLIANAEAALARLQRTWELTPHAQSIGTLLQGYEAWHTQLLDTPKITLEDVFYTQPGAFSPYAHTPHDLEMLQRDGLSLEFIRTIALHCTGDQAVADYRSKQIWIGGTAPKHAHFIPPHPKDLEFSLQNLITFSKDATYPFALRIALGFAFFFLVLPFQSSNARINRYLVDLQLAEHLGRPTPPLPFAQYLARHLHPLNQAILSITTDSTTTMYLQHFLTMLTEAAQYTSDKVAAISQTIAQLEAKLDGNKTSLQTQHKLLAHLIVSPYCQVKDVMQLTSLSKPNANLLVKKFQHLGILTLHNNAERGRVFAMRQLCDILS